MHTIITLTTDFGFADPWVGIMKGVMLSINPELVFVDLAHGIQPQDIVAGALALADSVPFFPRGSIHVAVIDPGVGSSRRPVVIKSSVCYFVGPDNGLFWPAVERLGGLEKAWQITREEFLLKPLSATFHGRDIFAPVAAHLSLGTPASEFGPEVEDLQKLMLPQAVREERSIRGEVIHIDSFGNLITNIQAEDLESLDQQRLEVFLAGVMIGTISGAYSEVPEGAAVAVVGSSGRLEIACFRGSAAAYFTAGCGTAVEVRIA